MTCGRCQPFRKCSLSARKTGGLPGYAGEETEGRLPWLNGKEEHRKLVHKRAQRALQKLAESDPKEFSRLIATYAQTSSFETLPETRSPATHTS